MKAHRLGETGEVLVTGTQDVDAATTAALHHLEHELGLTDTEAAEYLEARSVEVTRGFIVPATKADREWLGYSWWWMHDPIRGRVRAVVFG